MMILRQQQRRIIQSLLVFLSLLNESGASFDLERNYNDETANPLLSDIMSSHIDHVLYMTRKLFPLSTSNNNNICDYYESFIDTIPNGRIKCSCTEQQFIHCNHDQICYQQQCADSVTMTMTNTNNNGLSMRTCSTSPGFEEVCLTVLIGNEEEESIQQCSIATYDGNVCHCDVCPDNNGIAVDCTDHHPMAFTNGCVEVDMSNLIGVIPMFDDNHLNKFNNNNNNNDNNYNEILELFFRNPSQKQPKQQLQQEQQEEEATVGEGLLMSNWEVDKPDLSPNSCNDVVLLDDFISNGQEKCGCSDTLVSCHFDSVCSTNSNGDNVCAGGGVDLFMDFSDGLLVSSCANYTSTFEEMCFDLRISDGGDQFSHCTGTYGGKECLCEVCSGNTNKGVFLDCSQYNPTAITNGCQKVTATDMYLDTDGECGEYHFVVEQIPEDTATCNCNGTAVSCEFEMVCHKSEQLCARPAEITINFDGEASISSCSEYTSDFEETCVDISIGADRLLDECNSVTYGDKRCFCEICDDRASVSIDCSMYHPRATTGMCQPIHLIELNLMELRPFIPEFQIDNTLNALGTNSFKRNSGSTSFMMNLGYIITITAATTLVLFL